MQVETFVGLRYLRSRKSSAFLSKITLISIAGVAVGVWALIVVLSVMEGFEEDLRDKIIGTNAHGNVVKIMGTFPEYRDVMKTIKENAPEVEGVSPFIMREVMITSDANVTGAILKGLDLATTNSVTDLQQYLDDALCYPDCSDPAAPHPKSNAMELLGDEKKLLETTSYGGYYVPPAMKGMKLKEDGAATTETTGAPKADEPGKGVAEDTSAGGGAVRELRKTLDQEIEALQKQVDARLKERRDDAEAARNTAETTAPAAGKDAVEDGDDFKYVPAFKRRKDLLKKKKLPGIIIGQEMAKYLSVFTGDVITVVDPLGGGVGPTGPVPSRQSFRVAGLIYSGMFEYDLKFAYATMKAVQETSDTDDVATAVEYRLKPRYIDDSASIAKRIESKLGGFPYEVRDWKAMNRNLLAALKMERIAMFIILTFIIMVAAFNILSTLIMTVIEKTKEIAILKSIGASNGTIMKIFMLQGTVIGTLGIVIGVALGVLTCLLIREIGIPLDQHVYYMPTIPVKMQTEMLITVPLTAVVICFVSTIYPSWKAARMSPVEGLRND